MLAAIICGLIICGLIICGLTIYILTRGFFDDDKEREKRERECVRERKRESESESVRERKRESDGKTERESESEKKKETEKQEVGSILISLVIMGAAIIGGVLFIGGLIIYGLFRLFCDDDISNVDSSALFAIAERLQKLHGGNVYVGLRIPDPDTGSRQSIDMVLVTKGELVVVSVKNFSGNLTISGDGSWVCENTGGHNKVERHPNPVAEARKQASILELYLEQRGVALPEGYISCRVILPNPKLCTIPASCFPSEVITHEQWVQLKPEPKSMFSSWVKSAFRDGKKEIQESVHQNHDFILSTAPIWDRLQLKGDKYILGEFLEFKGKEEDVQALGHIRRSKVDRMIIQKTSMFGPDPSRFRVSYALRDYRTEGASAPEWKEVTVIPSTEIIFQPKNASKDRKFKLSSVGSMSLSA